MRSKSIAPARPLRDNATRTIHRRRVVRVSPARAAIGLGVVVIVVAAIAAACGDKPTEPTPTSSTDTIATITLLPPDPAIPVGSTLALTAFLANAAGDEIIGRDVSSCFSMPAP